MKNVEVSNLKEVSTQVDVVSNLLDVILEDLLYFGKLNPLDGDTLEKAKVATLCNNLPKSQALLSLAQEQINDIQKRLTLSQKLFSCTHYKSLNSRWHDSTKSEHKMGEGLPCPFCNESKIVYET